MLKRLFTIALTVGFAAMVMEVLMRRVEQQQALAQPLR